MTLVSESGTNKKKKCIVGLSGGVDSATSAFIMKEREYDVIACTLKLFNNKKAEDSIKDATDIADFLKIPLEVIDCAEEFEKTVIDYFVSYYREGKTPSPCVICNEHIKFKYLSDMRKRYNADLIVTGHYAKIVREANDVALYQGRAKNRDQSYFLYAVDRDALRYAEFPLGDVESKADTREMARKAGIKVAEKSDSQDVCFIENNDYIAFIKRKLEGLYEFSEGNIVDSSGMILGKHKGTINYTIGQRKGLGLSGGPFFVSSINAAKNEVVVSRKEDIQVKSLHLKNVKFIRDASEGFEGECQVKIRSCGMKISAKIEEKGTKVTLLEPEYGAAPGQHCVFYRDSSGSRDSEDFGERGEILGGGEIESCDCVN